MHEMRKFLIGLLVCLLLIGVAGAAYGPEGDYGNPFIVTQGKLDIAAIAAPGAGASGQGRLYFDSTTHKLYYYPSNGGSPVGPLIDSTSAAPTDATYITQTPNSTLSAEQALSLLSTGIMKVTTTTGVVSSLAIPLTVANGGTNATTAAAARVSLLPSMSSNTLKLLRVNAGETDAEWVSASSVPLTIGDSVSGGGANRVLYEDGSQNLAAFNGFTDNHIVRADGTGMVQDTGWNIADTTNVMSLVSANAGITLTPSTGYLTLEYTGNNVALATGINGNTGFSFDKAGTMQWCDGVGGLPDTQFGRVAANALSLGTGDELIIGSTAGDHATTTNGAISYDSSAGSFKIRQAGAWLVPATVTGTETLINKSIAASEVNSGTLGTARLGSGSATSTTLLHGDSTWGKASLTADVSGVLPAANGGAVLPSMMQPAVVAPSAAPMTGTSGTSYALYIGRASGAIANMTLLADVRSLGVLGTPTCKFILCSGTLVPNGNATLTAIASSTVSSTGTQTVALTSLGIATGTDLWGVVWSQGTTPWQFYSAGADFFQSGVVQTFVGDASSGSNAFTIGSTSQTCPWIMGMSIS